MSSIEERHLKYWTSDEWQEDWYGRDDNQASQDDDGASQPKRSKGRKRKAWLNAQITALKEAGRWIGNEPSAEGKRLRLAQDRAGCFKPRQELLAPW